MTGDDLEAFRTWLVTQSGLTAVTAKIGPLPDSPDRIIGIRDYPGPETPNWRADYRVQIRCRGDKAASAVNSFKSAHDLADLVVAAVAPVQDDLLTVTLAGSKKAIVRLVGSRIPMGPDAKGREEIAVNIALDVARV